MPGSSFSDLSPIFFLQTFVLELMHAIEQQGRGHSEELIESIAKTAGRFFETAYREEYDLEGALDVKRYTDLIIGLKNKIGGQFSLDSYDQNCVKVVNKSCPFGDRVKHSPELCRMTSSVFGGIAARNFGYAKVEISKSIAQKHDGCEVTVYVNSDAAKAGAGLEYFAQDSNQQLKSISELHLLIEESMQKIWRVKEKTPSQRAAQVIVAKSPAMQKVLQAIERIAPTVATVLIIGETGVGKELVARAIHAMSKRSHRPFMAVNCGAIPESLIESALFGHEKGAFTGAVEIHQGVFERANGGTLFLDEVDSLSSAAQTRLLRVIQEGELERVGGKHTIDVDVRLVSATNQKLENLVENGLFRNDLFYRINVVQLKIPPLCQRNEDFPYLVQVILKKLSSKYGRNISSVSREVMKQIRNYDWPGNVRELENVLEHAVLFSDGDEVIDLNTNLSKAEVPGESWKEVKDSVISNAERMYLQDALRRCRGDIKEVANLMMLTPRAVYGKLKKHRIEIQKFRDKAD